MNLHSFVSKNQYGFKKNSTTTCAVFDLVSNVSKCFSTKECCICVFLNIRKTFDSVIHTILLDKLFRMGFSRNFFELFKSYLFNWCHYFKVNGCKFQNRKIDNVVLQGSVLDPLLFILFIKDITSVRCDGKELFADDGIFGSVIFVLVIWF